MKKTTNPKGTRILVRALVLYHGDIQAEVSGETMNESNIMRLATGG